VIGKGTLYVWLLFLTPGNAHLSIHFPTFNKIFCSFKIPFSRFFVNLEGSSVGELTSISWLMNR